LNALSTEYKRATKDDLPDTKILDSLSIARGERREEIIIIIIIIIIINDSKDGGCEIYRAIAFLEDILLL